MPMKYLILSVLVVCSTNIVDAQTRDKEKSVFRNRNIEMLDIGNFIFRPDLWRTKIDTFASNDENKKFKFK